MRKTILMAAFLVPVLALLGYAGQSYEPYGEVYGYGSEEAGTGAYLGVDITDITRDRLSELKLKEEQGVEVTMVDQDAPAGKAGVKEHDVILSINGTPVESGAQLRRVIRETPPGRIITLNLSRDGQPLSLKVQLADRRKTMSWGPKAKEFKFTMPAMPPVPDIDVPVSVVVVHSSMRSGLMVENITPQLGEFFGVKNGGGVLVRSVEKGSRAEKAGIRAGDVVVRVNEEGVHDTSDFTRALRSRAGNSVTLGIMRDKKEQTFTLTLPDRKESGALIEDDMEQIIEVPDFDEEALAGLADVETEIARVQPQVQLAIEQQRRVFEKLKADPCLEEEEIGRQQEEIQKQADEMKEQLEQQKQEMLEQERELEDQGWRFSQQLPI
jgi:membrane-associated protease RseP (regulator of RpoE activity)